MSERSVSERSMSERSMSERSMSERSTSKSAIITGASSGIGLVTAQRLAQDGYQVEGLARDFSSTDTALFTPHEIDLANLESLPNDLDVFSEPPELLILNAGYGRFGGIEQFSHQQIRHLIDTNLVSNLFLIKHFLPKMKTQGGGDIVLIGSESALQGARAGAVYCASKFALRGLAQSLRADCSNSDIRVILINPGPVETDFFDDLNFAPQQGVEFAIDAQSVARAITDSIAQPRHVVCEEINLQPMKRSFRKT
jgi:3-hydroxy acid dehydrogenase/malonic semialdehyde reductase